MIIIIIITVLSSLLLSVLRQVSTYSSLTHADRQLLEVAGCSERLGSCDAVTRLGTQSARSPGTATFIDGPGPPTWSSAARADASACGVGGRMPAALFSIFRLIAAVAAPTTRVCGAARCDRLSWPAFEGRANPRRMRLLQTTPDCDPAPMRSIRWAAALVSLVALKAGALLRHSRCGCVRRGEVPVKPACRLC